MTVTISNAIVATGLGVFAYIVGRSSRNAALGHALWVLVLVKLVTPPVVDLPLAVLPEWAVANSPVEVTSAPPAAVDLPAPNQSLGHDGQVPVLTPPQTPIASTTKVFRRATLQSAMVWFMRFWVAGIVCYGIYQIYVTCQMWRLMKMASPDSRIDRAMHRIAKAAKVKNYPIARVVPWVGSPMLWGLGGTSVIVLPAALFESLDDEAADTLMQHELAHFQRGDQWVRILQAVVSVLYWWHPIVWLSSRQIEIYEEQCCDAWVVRQNRPNRRRYAEALLDTVDFISDAPEAALPVAASGLGRVPLLEQRLTSIMRGDSQCLSWRGKAAVVVLLLILPLQPRLSRAFARSNFIADAEQMTVEELDKAIERERAIESKTVLQKMKALAAETQKHLDMTAEEKRQAVRTAPGIDYAKAISPLGRFQLIAKSGRYVRLVDAVSNSVYEIKSHQVMCAAFSPDATQFVVGTQQGKVLLYDTAPMALDRELAAFSGVVRSVAFSPDGEWLAIGGDLDTVRLIGPGNKQIDFTVGTDRDKLSAGRIGVSSVRFNATGSRLAVALDTTMLSDAPGLVEIWNFASKEKEQTITCPTAVGVAGFDEAGHVLTAEWNGEMRVWSAPTKLGNWFGRKPQLLGVATAPKDGISAAAFSANAMRLEEMVEVVAVNTQAAQWQQIGPGRVVQ